MSTEWQRSCVLNAFKDELERLHHAGLNADGSLCLLCSYEDDYVVADTTSGETIWSDPYATNEAGLPTLDEWIQNGYVELKHGRATARFRIFGLFENYPLHQCARLRQELEIDVPASILNIKDSSSGRIIQTLPFEAFSGDWAFASFSDDYSTVAVLEPYYVTLFRRNEPLSSE